MKLPNSNPWQSAGIGLIIGALFTSMSLSYLEAAEWWPGHSEHDHDVSYDYHTHADFVVVINDTVLDLADPAYMSTAERVLAPDVHLHDNDGKVIHYHAPDLTFASFLESISITLTDTCLTAASQTVCTTDETEIALFVNEKKYTEPLSGYVSIDLDRVLLYAGPKLGDTLPRAYLDLVEDRACIFSGTCPERGVAPPESCGLTCEL